MRRDYKRDFAKPRGSAHGVLLNIDCRDVVMVEDMESHGQTNFSLPGGRIKYGEGYITTLKEEVKEETGLFIKDSIRNLVYLKKATRYFPDGGEQRFYMTFSYEGIFRTKSYKKETGSPFYASIVDAIKREDYLHLVHRVALMYAIEHLNLFGRYPTLAFELYDVFDRLKRMIKSLRVAQYPIYIGEKPVYHPAYQ